MDYSFNTGSIEALRRLGGGSITKAARVKLYNYLTDNFGLGKRTGIEIYDAPGIIISPEEDEGNAVRYANMTFGQGMNLTMVQVAAAFSSLVNGGDYYEPTIIAGEMKGDVFYKNDNKKAVRRSITESTVRKCARCLRRCVAKRYHVRAINRATRLELRLAPRRLTIQTANIHQMRRLRA